MTGACVIVDDAFGRLPHLIPQYGATLTLLVKPAWAAPAVDTLIASADTRATSRLDLVISLLHLETDWCLEDEART
jgi:hypothetical protein